MIQPIIKILSVVATSRGLGFSSIRISKLVGFQMLAILFMILGSCSNQLAEDELDAFSASRVKPYLNKLILVNAATQQDIGELTENYSFNASSVNIRSEGTAASVLFQLTGAETDTETDNIKPYASKGDVSGVYNSWTPTVGNYTLKATPYSQKNGKGIPGNSITVNFQVKAENITVTPILDPVVVSPSLYFQGDFTNATVDRLKIRGWDALEALPEIEAQDFGFDGGEQYVNASIKTFDNKKVLYAEVNDDDPAYDGQSRFQWMIFLQKKLEVLHFQYNIYLSPDIAELNSYPNSIKWFSIFEMWNERAPDLQGSSGSARWNLNIHKDATGSIYWAWESEYMQPDALAFNNIYPDQINRTSAVPLGKWITLDIYFNRNGKTTVKVDNTVIFDFMGQNTYPGKPELYPGYNGWNIGIYKLYTSDEILDWMRPRNKKIWAMYENFKWFKE